ncbi:ABC transporter permease [Gluconacetobacter azotocaptans]|uniref:ABC transporter permease n=1 Tax=Gluconacetobacter azotocaptans TaxID=142834 RepID=A0A7W4PF21_9PROT|nr:ABC transporter permease [Gluconacetobacter azotocaptans]MBB2190109.1 ABC transporter permease [Gluconacetobacter azotocaptans]GBQ26190.1 dipeptide/oligopeptide/nickel ABC transporter permease [Gluconacetobacter azotocaptans DSM 13594]
MRRVGVLPLRAWIALGVAGFWLLCAFAAPLLSPFDPLRSGSPLLLPLARDGMGMHLLGTDMLGRDILSRLIWGARPVLLWSVLATVCAYAVGIGGGMAAGYASGAADRLFSFLATVMQSFPVLILYLLIVMRLGASGFNIIVAVTFSTAPAIFRIVRALVAAERGKDYVLAAVMQGERPWRILLFDLLPNVAGPLLVDACLRLGYTAITIGLLGFLGLGLPPPTPDWGSMINEGRGMAIVFPHLILFPCLAISSLMLSLSVLADALGHRGDSTPLRRTNA